MIDAAAAPVKEQSEEDKAIELKSKEDRKWIVLPGSTEQAASFQFKEEDHTLGNALRYIIMKNPNVEFCGYSIPHPSEELMNIRIQTYEGTAVEALLKGLDDLIDLCDIVSEKFVASRKAYVPKPPKDSEDTGMEG
jgi:DNA-directed RNA polymerase I and III subunit RPAC2